METEDEFESDDEERARRVEAHPAADPSPARRLCGDPDSGF